MARTSLIKKPLESNKALNGIKSTLKSDYMAAKNVWNQAKGYTSNLMTGKGKGGAAYGFSEYMSNMADIPNALFTKMGGGWGAAGRMAGYGATGTAGGIAVADLLNPWGMGWGD